MGRFWYVIGGMAAAMILAISPAIGSDNEHAHEAEYHADEAVKHAGMGHPRMVAKEAEKGLAFAKKAVETDNADEVLKKVVTELESAVKQGQNGDVDAAGKHVRWSRLSEQQFRVVKWNVCRVKLPCGLASG